MNAPSDGTSAGQSRGQAGEADSLGLDDRQAMKGLVRPLVSGSARWIAETQRATAEAKPPMDPLVADLPLSPSERKPDNDPRTPSEPAITPTTFLADLQALKTIDSRHEPLRVMPDNTLDAAAAREAVAGDVSALNGFVDKTLKGRAASVMGETADQHQAYRTALREASPQYAGLSERAFANDQLKADAKDASKAFEFADRRDDAANSIFDRYATMARAGLTVADLQGPALDRLAIKDSRDLMLLDGFPPHSRATEAKALVADNLKSEAYRATFDRERVEWATHSDGGRDRVSARTTPIELPDQASALIATPSDPKQSGKARPSAEQAVPGINSMRSEGAAFEKRRAIPPLEDRFNVKRIGLVEKEYRFRDQAGKVAFTDKLLSISTSSESAAAIKAMVDRAAERGWKTVHLSGSPEFVRQGWIAATAQGLTAVGHTPTEADRDAAANERARLRVGQDGPAPQRPGEAIQRDEEAHVDRGNADRTAAELREQRQLATAIEKALVDGKVSPELRGQVRALMAAEGARRVARGERLKVPVYDARAPRARVNPVQAGPQRFDDRERSR